MNFVLAFVLLLIFFMAGSRPLVIIPDEVYPLGQQSLLISSESTAKQYDVLSENILAAKGPYVEEVLGDSLAANAGIRTTDRIVALNGEHIRDTEALVAKLAAIPKGETLTLSVHANTVTRDVTLTKTEDRLGIVFAPPYIMSHYSMSPQQAVGAAWSELGIQTTLLLTSLGDLGKQVAQQGTIPEEIGGPVKIAEAVHMANQIGYDALLTIAILLSVNLGVLNILPIPALDGGRIFFLIIEGITRKRIKPAWEARAHIAGYMLLMLLMLVVTGRDLLQLFSA